MFAPKITSCLWFDGNAQEAAEFYTSIFANSSITHIQHYPEAGRAITGGKPGAVMTVSFKLNGHPFVGLNGGPMFKFNEAVSFQVHCSSLEEVDYFWEKLGEGGDEKKKNCGWLADKFGLSWQVIPTKLFEKLESKDEGVVNRTTDAMLKMKKLDMESLEKAAAEEGTSK